MNPLPRRPGPKPQTTSCTPHGQLDQQPTDPAIRTELAERAFSLPGVHEQPSAISVPGARALVLQGDGDGPASAFLTGREFAHLHPDPDWSLHLTLAEDLARNAIGAGWAEPHFLAQTGALPPTVVLVYAPRDRTELDVVWHLLQESQRFATGALDAPAQREPQP